MRGFGYLSGCSRGARPRKVERLLSETDIFPLRDDAKMKTRIPLSQADEQARLRRERLNLSIAEMGLSVRTTNCLEETGILTVRDLLNSTPKRLLSISNFGEKTLDEVYASLENLGFYRPGHEVVSS